MKQAVDPEKVGTLQDWLEAVSNRTDEVLETLQDEAGHTYTFPDYTLAAGEQVTLHTGRGTDTASDLYWGAGAPVWNNAGDRIIIETADGTRILEESYT